jgi:magnesium transporter
MSCGVYYCSPDGEIRDGLEESEIRQVMETKQGLLWVDICETTAEDGAFLEETFHFHPLTVEDCISPLIHPPKIDDFDDYIFMILHGIDYAAGADIVETAELAIFLGQNFVVSNHNTPLYGVDAVKQQVAKDGRPMKRGADFLAHALADTLIDNILPTIDKMSDIAEDIEEQTIRDPRQTTLEAILRLKRSTLRVHRVMAPQRELFNRLSRGDFKVIKDEAKIFYRDVYDHLVRIDDLNQTIRETGDNALGTYL